MLAVIVAIHQPQYLPWLGYFDKIDRADVFCYLDDVQYKKNEWQNRNRIKTAQGWQWLTVPVAYRFPERINRVRIPSDIPWAKKHLHALVTNYRKAPFFKDYIGIFEGAYARQWEYLADLNIYLIEQLKKATAVASAAQTVRSSTLELREDPTERLIDICLTLGADRYLAGAGARNYMDFGRFSASGIQVVVQDFRQPHYPQLYGRFQSHLSIVDLIFNCGPESIHQLRSTR